MKKRVSMLLCAMSLASCESYSALTEKAPDAQFKVGRNYQAVYAGTLGTMRKCLKPGTSYFPSPTVTVLDAQLYPDLGYGEISHGLSGLTPTTYFIARIERAGSGTVVKVTNGNQSKSASAGTTAWIAYWVKGGTACPEIGKMLPPA